MLNYIVALESMVLGSKNQGELTYRLRLRASHLLARKRKFTKQVSARVGELYNVRSEIVHRGSFLVSTQLRDTARLYASTALLNLLRDPAFFALDTEDAVEDWFEAPAFGPRARKAANHATTAS